MADQYGAKASGISKLPLTVANAFAAGMLDRLARDMGVRAFVIKGPILSKQGIRSPRWSSDVDFWVDPEKFSEFLERLDGLGWRRRPEALSWSLFVTHSVTLVNPNWPCDIDVHRTFPGMFSAPQEHFEKMWNSCSRTEVAPNIWVWAPGRPHHVVVALLHALRSGRSVSAQREAEDIVERVGGWNASELEAVRSAAVDLHADAPLLEALSVWGVPSERSVRSSHDELLWEIRRRSERHTFNWMYAVFNARGWERIALLKRGLFPTAGDIEASYPEVVRSTGKRVYRRVERYFRAAVNLPLAARDVVRLRRLAAADGSVVRAEYVSARRVGASAHVVEVSEGAAVASGGAGEGDVRDQSPGVKPGGEWAAESVACERDARRSDASERRLSDDGIFTAAMGSDLYVFNADSPALPPLFLSASAAELWDMLVRRGVSPESAVQEICSAYDVESDLVAHSVSEFQRAVRPYLALPPLL